MPQEELKLSSFVLKRVQFEKKRKREKLLFNISRQETHSFCLLSLKDKHGVQTKQSLCRKEAGHLSFSLKLVLMNQLMSVHHPWSSSCLGLSCGGNRRSREFHISLQQTALPRHSQARWDTVLCVIPPNISRSALGSPPSPPRRPPEGDVQEASWPTWRSSRCTPNSSPSCSRTCSVMQICIDGHKQHIIY